MCPFTIKSNCQLLPCQLQGPGLHFIKQGVGQGEGRKWSSLHDAMFSSAHSNTHISMTETAKLSHRARGKTFHWPDALHRGGVGGWESQGATMLLL